MAHQRLATYAQLVQEESFLEFFSKFVTVTNFLSFLKECLPKEIHKHTRVAAHRIGGEEKREWE